MTDFYAQVVNDEIVRSQLTAKQARIGLINFPSNATDDDFRDAGFYPIVGSKPTSTMWQRVSGPTRSVNTEDRNVELNYTVEDLSLAECKEIKRGKLREKFLEAMNSGTTINGVLVSTTDQAQGELDRLLADLQRREAAEEESPTQAISTRSGAVITCDVSTALALVNGVAEHVRACWANDASKATAINNAANPSALDAIDVAAGWPS